MNLGQAQLPATLQVGGTVLSTLGQYQKGQAQALALQRHAQANDFAAAQLDQNAGQAQAASQRAAADETRNAQYAQSRALAVAAASGGGASDPTVMNIISRIAGEGQYRAMTDLYQGEDKARAMRMQAAGQRFDAATSRSDASAAKKAGAFGATSTLMMGLGRAGLYSKYWAGPKNGQSGIALDETDY